MKKRMTICWVNRDGREFWVDADQIPSYVKRDAIRYQAKLNYAISSEEINEALRRRNG